MALTRKEHKDSSATHWTSFSVRKITERVLKIIYSVSFVRMDTFLKFRAIWQVAVKVNFQVVISLRIATLTPKNQTCFVICGHNHMLLDFGIFLLERFCVMHDPLYMEDLYNVTCSASVFIRRLKTYVHNTASQTLDLLFSTSLTVGKLVLMK